MMMTKQEVKDEWKNTEGSPEVKQKQRQRMAEVSRRRMMQAVPEADVVITNPTHFAVALKYEQNKGRAPVVVARVKIFWLHVSKRQRGNTMLKLLRINLLRVCYIIM